MISCIETALRMENIVKTIAIATETPNDRFFNRLDIRNCILPKQEKYLKERTQKASTKILFAGLKRLKLSVKLQKNYRKKY